MAKRGRPRLPNTGEWHNHSGISDGVRQILGERDRTNFETLTTATASLVNFAEGQLGRQLGTAERDRLRRLAAAARPSVVERPLLAWFNKVSERTARDLMPYEICLWR